MKFNSLDWSNTNNKLIQVDVSISNTNTKYYYYTCSNTVDRIVINGSPDYLKICR